MLDLGRQNPLGNQYRVCLSTTMRMYCAQPKVRFYFDRAHFHYSLINAKN